MLAIFLAATVASACNRGGSTGQAGGSETDGGAGAAQSPSGGTAAAGADISAVTPGGTTLASISLSADTPKAGGAAAVCTTTGTIDVNVAVKTAAGAAGAAAPVPLTPGLTCQNIYDPARSDYVPKASGDFLAFLKALNPGYLRWPTGYLSQKYQWSRNEKDGTIMDGGSYTITPALLAAYMQLVHDTNSRAYITVNIVDATPASVADMVRFANIESKYGIVWWELGNEPDVNGYVAGKYTPELYAAKAVATAAAMRAVDPTIKLVAGAILSGENIRGVKPVDDSHAPISWARPIFEAFKSAQMDGFAWHYYPMNASSSLNCGSTACYCWNNDPGCTSPGYLLQENADDWPPAGLNYASLINNPSADGDSDNGKPFIGLRQMMNSYKPGMAMWIDEFAEDPSSLANGSGLSDKNIGMLWSADAMGRFADQGTESICKFLYKTDANSPQFKYTLLDETNKPRPSYYTYWLYGQHYGDMAVSATSDKIAQVAAHAAVRKQDGSLRLVLVNKNAAAQSTRVTLQDFKPSAAAQYQAITDSLYGTGVTLNGGSLSSNTIGQGGSAIASVRAEACGDTVVKLPPYSVTLIIFAK